jgi:hypothetical protein
MVDHRYLGNPKDVTILSNDPETAANWRQWAAAAQQYNVPTFVQLCV